MEFFKTEKFNKISKMHLKFFSLKSSQNVENWFFFCKKRWNVQKTASQNWKSNEHGYFHLQHVPKDFTADEFSKLSEFGLFWKNKQITWKRRFKTFENFNFASFFSNTSRTLLLLMCFEDIQNFRFFGKRIVLFSREHLKIFKKTKHGYFPSECLSNFIIAYAVFKRSKFEFFLQKNDVFRRKNPWKTSGALFGFFYRDCVSDVHIASELSKQSKFWVFFGKIDIAFEKILFFPKSVKVAFFF